MPSTPPPAGTDPPDLTNSPLYLLAVLHSARRSQDRALEQVTRHRLAKLGVRVVFDESPAHPPQEGVGSE